MATTVRFGPHGNEVPGTPLGPAPAPHQLAFQAHWQEAGGEAESLPLELYGKPACKPVQHSPSHPPAGACVAKGRKMN